MICVLAVLWQDFQRCSDMNQRANICIDAALRQAASLSMPAI
jgi:hypothetical protein